MSADENTVEHALVIKNRERLSITGVKDVDAFNEEQIIALSDYGELSIKGDLLHIEELNIDNGTLEITGKINEITYSTINNSTSVLKRLFGG